MERRKKCNREKLGRIAYNIRSISLCSNMAKIRLVEVFWPTRYVQDIRMNIPCKFQVNPTFIVLMREKCNMAFQKV